MTQTIDLAPAARQLVTLLDGVTDEQLGAPTPCTDYTIADILDHLMGLALAFTDAATKSLGTSTGQAPQVSAANLDPDWRTMLPKRLADLAAAWRTPGAWEGMTQAGGVTMPAEAMGLVALDEVVVHAWDLARATGQPFTCDQTSAEAILGPLAGASPDGEEGMFGPIVAVSEDASPLDRAVGLTGRDPSWAPPASA